MKNRHNMRISRSESECQGPRRSQPNSRFPASPEKIAAPPTLLVVDDDPVFRELETRALCQKGYNVLQAGSPAEALRLAPASVAIDMLLTDFVMPEVNGLELARQFRALHPEAPVLMVSGSLPRLQRQVEKFPRFALLEKSAKFDELLGKVHALLTEASPLPSPTS
jgi:DNA-binding response OmpR family regulator